MNSNIEILLLSIFELLPVVLAIIASVTCSRKAIIVRRAKDRIVMGLGVFSALLLVVAQTSWWATYILQNSLQGTGFANSVWTVFNTLTMAILIFMSVERK